MNLPCEISHEQVQVVECGSARKSPKGLTILKPRQQLLTLTVVWLIRSEKNKPDEKIMILQGLHLGKYITKTN